MSILRLLPIWITVLSVIPFTKGDVIYIEPRDRIVKYLGDDLTLICHHSIDLGRPEWIANGLLLNMSNPLFNFVTFIDNPPSLRISEIIIHNMNETVNETKIQCFSEVSPSSIISNTTTILLQGKLEAVGSLDFEIDERDLLITWSSPFTLDLSNPIQYKIKIVNETSMEESIFKTVYNFTIIRPNIFRLITCDDFNVSVIPMNKLGCGNTCSLSIKSEALLDANALPILSTRQNTVDLLVGVTSFLCSITNIVVKNIYLNETISMTTFSKFKWYNAGVEEPHYLLTLEMEERFLYEINMTFNNNRGNLTKKYTISTHELNNVEIAELDGQIQVSLLYSGLAQERNGVFLMLLNCPTMQCDSFNFTKSIFLSTYGGLERAIYNKPYYYGYFKSFAFDAYPNGSIRSSAGLINQSYSIQSTEFYLEFGSTEELNVSDGSCSYQYNNESIFSSCNTNTMRPSDEQQIVQIPSDFGQGESLLLSDCYPLNESACIKRNSPTEYILSVIVSSDFNLEITEPLGKQVISTEEYIDTKGCDKGNTPPTEGNDGLALELGLGLGLSTTLAIIIGIIGIIAAVIIYRKCKNKTDAYNPRQPPAPPAPST